MKDNTNIKAFGCSVDRRPYFLYVFLFTTLACASAISIFGYRKGYTLEASLAIAYIGLVICGVEILTWVLFFGKKEDSFSGTPGLKLLFRLLLLSFGTGLILEVATIFSIPYGNIDYINKYDFVRVLVFAFWAYILALLFEFYLLPKIKVKILNFKNQAFQCSLFVRFGLIAAFVIVSYFLGYLMAPYLNCASLSGSLFAAAISIIISTFFIIRENIYEKLHILFLATSLSLGLLLVFALPCETGVCWDDDTHYYRSNVLSYIVNPYLSEADISLYYLEDEILGVHKPYNGTSEAISDKKALTENVNQFFETCLSIDLSQTEAIFTPGIIHYSSGSTWCNVSFSSVGNAPAAIGIWLGRLVSNSFVVPFVLGKLFNLLTYVVFFTIAIKITPVKKLLFLLVGLFPTCLFLASSYSYDPFLIALTSVSVALILKSRYEEKLLSGYTWALMLFTMFLGLCTKAVYFPLYGLFLLIPKTRFTSNRTYIRYVASACGALLLTVLSFAAPFMVASSIGDVGDMRGGSEVNSPEQIAFILNNIPSYFQILCNYFSSFFLNPSISSEYAYFFGYLRNTQSLIPAFKYLAVILLAFVTLFDSVNLKIKLFTLPNRIWVAFIFLCSIVLIATALYVSYTPVALDTVNGCQPRYLLPLLVPLCSIVFHFRCIDEKFNRIICNFLVLMVVLTTVVGVGSVVFAVLL